MLCKIKTMYMRSKILVSEARRAHQTQGFQAIPSFNTAKHLVQIPPNYSAQLLILTCVRPILMIFLTFPAVPKP